MVSFSLYRGNLHTVPDVPRRWLMPTPIISVKDFRVLLHRRNRAIARSQSNPDTPNTSSSNPNSDPQPHAEDQEEINGLPDSNDPPPPPSPLDPLQDTGSDVEKVDEEEEGESGEGGADRGEKHNNEEGLEVGDDLGKLVDGDDVTAVVMPEGSGDAMDVAGGSLEEKPLENPNEETTDRVNVSIEKEKRKKEVEGKMHTLNEKKHDMVKALKKMLNAEEELKKRNNTQGTGTRPSVSLQVDVTNDSGSMTRNTTPRLGSDGNIDTEAGESDNASNQNAQSRHLPRMSSISPSSASLHRKPFFSSANKSPHRSRAYLPVGGSPSSFALPANPPTVAVSGASYIASSPSPAASGGTSAFRDITVPSPRN